MVALGQFDILEDQRGKQTVLHLSEKGLLKDIRELQETFIALSCEELRR